MEYKDPDRDIMGSPIKSLYYWVLIGNEGI